MVAVQQQHRAVDLAHAVNVGEDVTAAEGAACGDDSKPRHDWAVQDEGVDGVAARQPAARPAAHALPVHDDLFGRVGGGECLVHCFNVVVRLLLRRHACR